MNLLDKKKVVVGVSGGLDSFMTALLLKNKGYDVIAIHLDLWDDDELLKPDSSINFDVVNANSSNIDSINSEIVNSNNIDSINENSKNKDSINTKLNNKNSRHLNKLNYISSDKKRFKDVRYLCDFLKIPLLIVDGKELFKSIIISYFINEYLVGRTPSPCVFCNSQIKWKLLKDVADELNIYNIATGHYVRKVYINNDTSIDDDKFMDNHTYTNIFNNDTVFTNNLVIDNNRKGLFYVRRGIDKIKDQSYYLWELKQDVLSRMLTPLGEYTKDDVRAMAKKEGFNNILNKRESMSICFLAKYNYGDFISKYIKQNFKTFEKNINTKNINFLDLQDTVSEKYTTINQNIVSDKYTITNQGILNDKASIKDNDSINDKGCFLLEDGTVLGKHKGILYYTIGQKKNVPLGPDGKKVYVIKIDTQTKNIILGSKSSLFVSKFRINNLNINNYKDLGSSQIQVAIRGVGLNPRGYVKIKRLTFNSIEIELSNPAWAIAPGQPVVMYIDDRVIGGGVVF